MYAADTGNPRKVFGDKLKGRKIMKAIWNGAILAESDETIVIEGNHYFPADAINKEFFRASETHTACPWKGTASYYDVAVGDSINKDAAWFYPTPKTEAAEIENHVAFWKGVEVAA
jgi:uncharacterized protein (DUF427 family)